jgi:hypothetical protein
MALAGQRDDRREQSAPVTDRDDADVSQIVRYQMGQHIGVDCSTSAPLRRI